MATKYWIGGAAAVAQVHTGSIDSVDATPSNNTFTVTIGSISVSVAGDTDVNTTATNLRAALNASTHPYFAAITWGGASGNIVATADTAGVEFVAALTETGAGTGTVTDFSVTTALAGPNTWSTGDNWSDGAAPAAADTVILRNSDDDIVSGLDQNTIDLTEIHVEASFVGTVGLKASEFATSSDGATTVTTVAEYRQSYLKIGWTRAEIGDHYGPGDPGGSARLKLENDKAGSSTTIVHSTASAGEGNRPPLMLLASNSSATLELRSGICGCAIDVPGETSTFGDIDVVDTSPSTQLFIGEGVTLTNYSQRGGDNRLAAAATVTLVTVNGGTLEIVGENFTITTATMNGGTVTDRHESSGAEITTLNMNGGDWDASKSELARTYSTVNMEGGSLSHNPSLTITTLNESTGLSKLTAEAL